MAAQRYWLMKSEPDCYSIDDLQREKKTFWDGVRNYQVRNFMRDDMKPGDLAFFYHSSTEPPGIVGVMTVTKSGYPDHTQFDPDEDHFDPKSSPDDPRWLMVDVKFVSKFNEMIPLSELKETPGLEKMVVTQRGSRLSVQPVTEEEWRTVMSLRS
ncbi:MAG: EVE domain-containing protein [Ignavibacteriae bacterium]|nr:EVE domain-containing protein [Ignavibacteriota bacterium]MCB9216016.1 EVE domain-containing protein [Ignavibacteria bacterium]